MNRQRQRTRQLSQLLRLQGLRVSTAEAAYRVKQNECAVAEAAMQERQVRITRVRQQREALSDYVVGQNAAEFARFAGFASARRAWLDESLERDEYWLSDDQRELREAEAQATEARQQWFRARARETGTQGLLDDTRRARAHEEEQRQEMEIAEQVTTPEQIR
jgi:hypothetical protein